MSFTCRDSLRKTAYNKDARKKKGMILLLVVRIRDLYMG